jgi:hypothetical protein
VGPRWAVARWNLGYTLAGTQAAQADAHVRLIGRVSSAWWWPGMKLLTNGR